MKLTKRLGMFLIGVFVVAVGAALFSTGVGAQEESWLIVRADYGFRNQRNDVTDILKDLVERGGVNGKVAVNNQTMGGDPAVGKDKVLRIFARNRRNEQREFDFNEDGFVDAHMFNLRVSVRRDDWDDRPAYYGDRDRDDWNGLRIIRAFYGVQGKTVNVTEVLRSKIRDGVVSLVVTNEALGGDPAIGADKTLIVVYRYQSIETATAVREGYTLKIP